MRTAVFAAIAASLYTTEAAHLQSFPSYDLAEMEQLEFAQTFNDGAFLDMMNHLAQNDNTPAIPSDIFAQGLSVADSKTFNELLMTTHVLADLHSHGWNEFWGDVLDITVDVLVAPVDLSVLVVGATIDLSVEAFDLVVEEAIKAADVITQGVVGLIKDLAAIADDINEIVKDPSKLTKAMVMKYLEKMPVVGDVIKVGKSGSRIFDRIVNGEQETCYRTGIKPRNVRFNAGDCPAPGTMVKGTCLLPCASNENHQSLICLHKCPAQFPVECGIMCTATEALCKRSDLVSKTTDLVNGAVAVVKTAGALATGNIVAFFGSGLKLIDDFAHPLCAAA